MSKQDDEKTVPDSDGTTSTTATASTGDQTTSTSTTAPTQGKTQESADNKPSNDGPPKGYVTEESYQGLQRVVSKKDTEIESLQSKLDTLSTQLEELKTNSNQLSGTKSNLENQLQEATTQLDALKADRDKLDIQLRQQGIVMKEFPALAAVAQYIPKADDDEKFRENAKQFAEAMNLFVDNGVKTVISGSVTPQPQSDDTAPETEEDRLWDEVYALAGVRGKEKEYNEAYNRLQQVLESKANK